MATVQDVQNVVTQIETASNAVLDTIEGLDPSAAIPTVAIQAVEGLVNAALAGLAATSGTTVVTVAELQSLLLNPEPGPEPAS